MMLQKQENAARLMSERMKELTHSSDPSPVDPDAKGWSSFYELIMLSVLEKFVGSTVSQIRGVRPRTDETGRKISERPRCAGPNDPLIQLAIGHHMRGRKLIVFYRLQADVRLVINRKFCG